MDADSLILCNSATDRNVAVDRFHDQLLARLIALRFRRLTLQQVFLALPLLAEPPLLALASAEDELTTQQIWRDLKFTLPCWLPVIHCLLCAWLLHSNGGPAAWSYDVWERVDRWLWLPAAALVPYSLMLSVWFIRRMGTVRADVRYWLTQSDLMSLLAFNDERLWSILDHTSVLLHTPFLLVRHRSPESALEVVGSNLDWYLEAPRPLLRPHWLAEVLLLPLALELVLFVPANGGLVSAMTNPVWHLMALLLVMCMMLSAYGARRREVFLEELILSLRTDFET